MFSPLCDIPLGQLFPIEQFPGQLQVVDDEQIPGPESDSCEPVWGDPGVCAPVYQAPSQWEEGKRAEERNCRGSWGQSASGEVPATGGQH